MCDSDLYLRYVLGEVEMEQLHVLSERHIRCNPAAAQFIIDPEFKPILCDGTFSKEFLDPLFVREQETLVTNAWRRLQQLPELGLPLVEYPLPEVRQRLQRNR